MIKCKLINCLLSLCLAVVPCIFLSVACKDKNSGTEHYVSMSHGEETTSSNQSLSLDSKDSEETASYEESEKDDDLNEEISTAEENASYDGPKDDFSEGDTPARPHVWIETTLEPTCTQDGYYKKWCETCGYVDIETIFKKFGHNVVTVEGYEPTCQEIGKTSYSYCDTCNEYFTQQQDIPKVNHDYTRGLGSCYWCDIAVLRYEIKYSYDPIFGKQPYAVCVGAENFTPFTIVRILEISDYVTAEIDGVYKDVPVTEIEEKCFFEWHDINKVILGKNLKKIGERAFRKCLNIREVYDKSSMRVGELSYAENGYLTERVKKEDVHYDENYTSKISVDKANGCILYTDGKEVELIGIRDTTEHVIIPEGVTKISGGVFYKTFRIRKLTIAKSVNYIAPYAFLHVNDEFQDEYHLIKEKSYLFIDEIVMLNPQGWCFYE